MRDGALSHRLALFGRLAWCGLLVFAGPALAQETALPLGESWTEMPYALTGEEITYATLADSLMRSLATWDQPERLLASLGFAPTSAASTELLALAAKLRPLFPPRSIESEMEIMERFAGNDAGFMEFQRQRNRNRFRAVGEAFGTWIEARKAEGYPPELLVERLLKRPYLGITLSSNVSLESLRSGQEDRSRAFEEGLRSVMDEVPRQFVVERKEVE